MYCYVYKSLHFDNWIVAFNGPEDKMNKEIYNWCVQSFGEPRNARAGYNPDSGRWLNSINYGEVQFRDEADAAWFVLRWA